MKKRVGFDGQAEEISAETDTMAASSQTVGSFFLDLGSPGRVGTIEVRVRSRLCLTLNPHEPRKYIVCWCNNQGYTNISFHSIVGGDHGALQAQRRMFELYAGKEE